MTRTRTKLFWVVSLLLLFCVTVLSGCEDSAASDVDNKDQPKQEGAMLDKVKKRGKVIIGVDTVLPGFGFLDSNGSFSGFDIEIGRAFAAAIFGDPEAAQMRPVTGQTRFTALQTGEIDILSRATTMSFTRDTSLGLKFIPTTFYDGQGVMARKDAKVETLKDLNGLRVGVEQGTTTELNLTEKLRKVDAKAEIIVFENQDAIVTAYEQGSIDAWTSDQSGLVSRLASMKTPADHTILSEVLSKEPLTPVVKGGDDQWFNVTKWIIYALIQAEEFGITKSNVDEFLTSQDPGIRRFLGLEGDLGKHIGLDNDFVVKLIKGVGNYSEIFEKNLGKESIFKLDRGVNALWTNGGLMFSPPFN
ncbi:amino acid ABC transporter substrate-binding protein [Paenibacillus eucommiae]|uniref:General L-amino acid transport system substrate-binding protein n=1 Tax=Paenibacillus eucommiae TaxID=1355755 RepID=A0ABS4J702_9BACL|nr:amino acid ABC transporter substrate-binding protein [Paenibacillus eucommiae]MBP1995632.1 general L-amino acid transport system substrate-binding protein [Paenibacillus eucommiae]